MIEKRRESLLEAVEEREKGRRGKERINVRREKGEVRNEVLQEKRRNRDSK